MPPARSAMSPDGHPTDRQPHAELLARHRRVLPDWLTLFYDEPIELVSGSGRHGHRRRGPHLSGLLRRHPHHHDRPRRARGGGRHPHPGRPHAAHAPPCTWSGPWSSWPSGSRPCRGSPTPRCSSSTPGARPTTPPCSCAARRGGPIRSWPCATATTGGRSPAWPSPGCGAGRRRASPRSTSATSTAVTATAARSAICPTTSTSPPASPTCEDVIRTATAGDVACLIAEPIQGVAGFVVPPDGLFGAMQRGARRARHPLHLRRGADRMGAHRRSLLGLPGPRHHPRPADLRQGPGQRAGHRRRRRTARPHRRRARQLHLDLRRQPAGHRRRPGQPRLSCCPTTCRPTPGRAGPS